MASLAPLQRTPREFVRDPVMSEFLGLPGSGKLLESELEQELLDHLQDFWSNWQGLRLRGATAAHQHRVEGLG